MTNDEDRPIKSFQGPEGNGVCQAAKTQVPRLPVLRAFRAVP